MKSILILRHAKSSWGHPEVNDHDRPLNKRGKRDAPLMGELLYNEHLIPEFIISSDAKRARLTAKIVAKAAGYNGKIALNQSLYAGRPAAYVRVLRDMPNEYSRVLMVGHNPALEELVSILTGENHSLSTCSLVHIQIRINKWTELENKTKGKLSGIWHPRNLI
jgi:phosphohistidine phosphatase